MKSSIKWRLGLGIFFVAAIFWSTNRTAAADGDTPFEGGKTTWHGVFDRYDFMMDDATGAITPMKAPEKKATSNEIDVTLKDGKRRCVEIVPQKAAPGYPWSWRGRHPKPKPPTPVELPQPALPLPFFAPHNPHPSPTAGHLDRL